MPKTHTPADTLRRLTTFDPLHESPTKTAREFKTLLRSLAHAIRSEEPELAAAAEFMLADAPDCQQFVAEHDARTIASQQRAALWATFPVDLNEPTDTPTIYPDDEE